MVHNLQNKRFPRLRPVYCDGMGPTPAFHGIIIKMMVSKEGKRVTIIRDTQSRVHYREVGEFSASPKQSPSLFLDNWRPFHTGVSDDEARGAQSAECRALG
jgi:hypothetical protein